MRASLAIRPGLLVEAVVIAGLLLLLGLAGMGGFAVMATQAPVDHVCTIVLPGRTSSIGAVVEMQERVAAADCRRGDVLAIKGDIHLDAVARFCDFSRTVMMEPPVAETGRPNGAVCAYMGSPRGLRTG